MRRRIAQAVMVVLVGCALVLASCAPGPGAGATDTSGPLVGWEQLGTRTFLRYEKASAMVEFANGGVHVAMAPSPQLPEVHSYAVSDLRPEAGSPLVVEAGGFLRIGLGGLSVRFDRAGLWYEVSEAGQPVYDALQDVADFGKLGKGIRLASSWRGERFFGYGERTGKLELTGRRFVNWNTDAYGYKESSDPLYSSFPVYMAMDAGGKATMVFQDSPARSRASFSKGDYSYSTSGPRADTWVFRGSPAEVLDRYTSLTGRPFMPPVWAFGFHQSRYSYMTRKEVMEVASQFARHDLPLDAIHLDIDFMKGYDSFTWNETTFPDPAGMNRQLARMGVRTVAIVDPAIRADPAHDIYHSGDAVAAFVTMPEGKDYYVGEVWPGMSVYPDFTKAATIAWWGPLYRRLTDLGISGFWNDMNEPADFSGSGTIPEQARFDNFGLGAPHYQVHNAYGTAMARASRAGIAALVPDRRVFLLSRAGYSGTQAAAFIWSGDNTADWPHIRMNMTMAINMGLSGMPWFGADIGGYAGTPSSELMLRWIQLASFMPYMRSHSAKGTPPHEPYQFPDHLPAMRDYMKLRYRLMPYLYTQAELASRTGMPLVRALFLDFGPEWLNEDSQFLFGPSILVAPIWEAGAKGRTVALPEGIWYDRRDGRSLQGGSHAMETGLEDIPVLWRGGSIIPVLDFDYRSTMDLGKGRDITLEIWPDAQGKASGSLYQDDMESTAWQEGAWLRTHFDWTSEGRSATLGIRTEGSWTPGGSLFVRLPPGTETLKVNGKDLAIIDGMARIK